MPVPSRRSIGGPFPADDPECELCQAARFTHWYAETDHGWIADCEVCSVPMVVWWHHGTEPDGGGSAPTSCPNWPSRRRRALRTGGAGSLDDDRCARSRITSTPMPATSGGSRSVGLDLSPASSGVGGQRPDHRLGS